MKSFLQTFGNGFLYFIGSPFILVALVIYGIYLFGLFLFMTIKGIVLFFKGKKLDFILPEDLKAEQILSQQMANAQNPQTNQNSTVTYNTFNQYNLHPNRNVQANKDFNQNLDYQNTQKIDLNDQGDDHE